MIQLICFIRCFIWWWWWWCYPTPCGR